MYENETKLTAQVETVTSANAPRPTNDAGDDAPRESLLTRVLSFNGRRTLSETRPPSFVVVNHTPQLGGDGGSPSPVTDGSRKGSAGEAIAARFIGSGSNSSSFRASRVERVQEEDPSALDIGDSSL